MSDSLRPLSSGHRTGKGQFSFQSQRKAMPKNAQATAQLALISHTGKVMLKILQARLQQYLNPEIPDVQAEFRKVRERQIKLRTSLGSLQKQDSSRKTSTSALLTVPMPLTVWITTNCGKFLKRWEYNITSDLSPEKCVCRSRSNS